MESGGADLEPSDWPHYLDRRYLPPSERFDDYANQGSKKKKKRVKKGSKKIFQNKPMANASRLPVRMPPIEERSERTQLDSLNSDRARDSQTFNQVLSHVLQEDSAEESKDRHALQNSPSR